MTDEEYEATLEKLQVDLVRYQQHAIETGERALVIFEGRDTAGKDGTIKRIVEHLSVRNTRVVALPKPNEVEKSQWYFQRYIDHLPSAGELVIFNRSWYNRAGVERVMGFASLEQQETFLRDVPDIEAMLVRSGIKLMKLWLDVSRKEQAERLAERRSDPLKALKVSPLDAVAEEKWDEYSQARDAMLTRTHTAVAPWVCVLADKKKPARLNVIRRLLKTLAPDEIARRVDDPDADVLFPFGEGVLTEKRLAQ
jgi:polyphosphate kinase 2